MVAMVNRPLLANEENWGKSITEKCRWKSMSANIYLFETTHKHTCWLIMQLYQVS